MAVLPKLPEMRKKMTELEKKIAVLEARLDKE
jgi:BMFP domain-containing protein YqiC